MYKYLASTILIFQVISLSGQDLLDLEKSVFASPQSLETIYEHDCKVAFEGIDQVENIRVKEMEFEHLFSFTPSDLKRQFGFKNLLECDGQIRRVEGQLMLKANIRINADKARGSYGLLQNGTLMRIILSDGTTIYLYNIKKNKGKIYAKENYTLYRGYFLIDEKDIKILKKYDVERIGIVWSAGYELYDMYNMDFFKRQLVCIDNE